MASASSGGRHSSGGSSLSASDWLQLYGRELLIGVVAVAVIGGGFFTYKRISAGNEQRAEQAFYAAQQAADPQQAEQALDRVVGAHEGTPGATQAALLLAQLRYDQGKYAEGIAALRRVERSAGKEFVPSVQALIAAGHEGQGQFAEAAAAYRKASEASRFKGDREAYLTEVARVLALAGDTAGATKIWEDIAADPLSTNAPEARVRLGELKAKPAAQG